MSLPATLDIAEATDADDIAACLALRHEVFCVEQGISAADEVDGKDGEARHLLARQADVPVATLRLRVVGPAAKLERVCVLAPFRGAGLGAALTEAALELAGTIHGVSEVRLGAQLPVIGFYERLGFIAEGPEYLDAGLPHRDMRRPLA